MNIPTVLGRLGILQPATVDWGWGSPWWTYFGWTAAHKAFAMDAHNKWQPVWRKKEKPLQQPTTLQGLPYGWPQKAQQDDNKNHGDN